LPELRRDVANSQDFGVNKLNSAGGARGKVRKFQLTSLLRRRYPGERRVFIDQCDFQANESFTQGSSLFISAPVTD